MASRPSTRVLGPHPPASHALGGALRSADSQTTSKVEHRALELLPGQDASLHTFLRSALETHHAGPAQLARTAALARQGLATTQARLNLYPKLDTTRKGNLAEILLAEYLVASTSTALPVYRLRYNPNVDQSMKGDDVLTFDLDATPVRIIIGEAKFRTTATSTVVKEIVDALTTSGAGGLPASLQFVANRLFDDPATYDLGERVWGCAALFANQRLRLDYVGLLLSDPKSATKVHDNAPASTLRLAIISLGMSDAAGTVDACYAGLT